MAVVYPIQYPIVLEVLDLVLSKTKYVEYWCTPRCLTKLKTALEFGFFGHITLKTFFWGAYHQITTHV